MSLDFMLRKKLCETCGNTEDVFDRNITHNLGKMASKAGIYQALWRPEEINAKTAGDLVPILAKGLEDLKARPDYFKKFNASNGWGMYKHFVPFVQECLDACVENPTAEILISR